MHYLSPTLSGYYAKPATKEPDSHYCMTQGQGQPNIVVCPYINSC